MKIEKINVDLIDFDAEQPRKNFDNIGKLSSNITKHGLMSPLEIVKKGDRYKLIDGERRLRAIKLLKWENVDCIVLKKEIKSTLMRQLSSDFHKNKLDLVEQAEAIQKLLNEGFEKREICYQLGLKETAYYSRLKILKLSPRAKQYVKEKKINLSDLHNLNNLELSDQERIIERIVKEKPSNEKTVRRIILEETDINFMINTYVTNSYKFNQVMEDFNGKMVLYLSDLSNDKKRFLKENNESIKTVVKNAINNMKDLLSTAEWQEKNFV